MKRLIITLVSIFTCISAYCQSNLFVEDGTLVWQKVYEESRTVEEIVKMLEDSQKVTYIQSTKDLGEAEKAQGLEGTVSCSMLYTGFDYEEAGFKRGGTPIYIVGNNFSAHVYIQVKEDRYRVTVINFTLSVSIDTPLADIGDQSPLEVYAVKNGALTRTAIKYLEPILDKQLDKLLTPPDVKVFRLDDEW